MAIYQGVEYKTFTVEAENGFYAKFSMTEHNGDNVVDHPHNYVIAKGEEEPILFDTEIKALEAAEQVVKIKIGEISS